MRGPEIISFNNGVIEWTTESGVEFCILEINGKTVSEKYTENAYKIEPNKNTEIKIIAVSGKKRAETRVMYDKTAKKFKFLPVTINVVGDKIKWSKTGGASSYRVYDVDFNAVTVFGTEYDLSDRNIALCVCPDSGGGLVESAEPEPSKIQYLAGSGTESDPYRIYTPFDLRTVDYYEMLYAQIGKNSDKPANYYRIENQIDYGKVNALESDSNLYTLSKPFFGTLDGNGNALINIRVCYYGGYWALFDYITASGCVKNIVFENAEIASRIQNDTHPINASVALIAHVNYGEIAGIKLEAVQLVSSGGGVSGIVTHNYGRVVDCSLGLELVQDITEAGAASYEMSGVALENLCGGVVCGNKIKSLVIRGTGNIRSCGGVVAVNRKGGEVTSDEYGNIAVIGATPYSEYGGIVAYNAGRVVRGGGFLGAFTVDGERVSAEVCDNNKGMLVGKNDGEIL